MDAHHEHHDESPQLVQGVCTIVYRTHVRVCHDGAMVFMKAEGLRWLRGLHDETSAAVKAMRVAQALRGWVI